LTAFSKELEKIEEIKDGKVKFNLDENKTGSIKDVNDTEDN
jgi:hypothetical protein